MSSKWDNDEVIQRLREYLKIPSVHPNIDYGDCVLFLKNQAKQLDLPVVVYEFVAKKPIVVITWTGLEPEQPSILLNSHMDVVPVYEKNWTYPPFEAVITEDGWIYARGIQDMKAIGMMHLEVIRRLKEAGVRLKRTVHISFVPDEEIGGEDGMGAFAASEEFKKLNIGFELDESMCSSDPNQIIIFYGERTSRQITITCKGKPGHGSLLPSGTAGEKGGVQVNVLPENLSVTFDIRIAPDVNIDEFEQMISQWCSEAGKDVTCQYFYKNPQIKSTVLDDTLTFWKAMKKEIDDMGMAIKSVICSGATDARYVRQQGIPAINFSPLMNSTPLGHADNERLHVDVYKNGIDIMEKVVQSVANV